jgi:hypothetical protein
MASGTRPERTSKGIVIMMRKRIALAALSTVAGIGAMVGLAGTASAADTAATGIIKQYATSYTSPSNTSIVVHKGLTEGTAVDVRCFREGQVLNGNGYWFLIEKNDELGYIHRDAISAPSDVPHC